MTLLRQALFVCVDCESTGLDPDKDQIIEVGAVRFTFDGVEGDLQALVNPLCPIPEESTRIHHITDEMVATKPPISEILPDLLQFLSGAILVGHGIDFDLKLIDNAAKAAGLPSALQTRPRIDTLRLARLYGESPTNSLEMLRTHFNIPAEAAHRAFDDALINMSVFLRLTERFKTLDEVFAVLAKPIRLKAMPLGKHKGRPFKEIPIDYLRWAVRQKFDQDLIFSMKEELTKRQSGSAFRQAANPFQEL